MEGIGEFFDNPLATGVGGLVLGGALGAGATALALGGNGNKSKRKRKKSSKSSNRKRRGRYTPRTAGKGKDRSRKRIRYTKNGQPYVLMSSGKAKFISKSSAKRSRARKGGRY